MLIHWSQFALLQTYFKHFAVGSLLITSHHHHIAASGVQLSLHSSCHLNLCHNERYHDACSIPRAACPPAGTLPSASDTLPALPAAQHGVVV